LTDSAAHKYLINAISGSTITVQRYPFSSVVNPATGAGTTQRAYATPVLWSAATARNIISEDVVFQGELWNDAEFSVTATIDIGNGATADATRYFHLTVAPGQSLCDQVNTTPLKYDQSKGAGISGNVTGTDLIYAHCAYVRITRLQIKLTNSLSFSAIYSDQNNVFIDKNLFDYFGATGPNYTIRCISGVTGTITNNILMFTAATSGGNQAIAINTPTGTWTVKNNTVVQCSDVTNANSYAIATGATATMNVANNAVFGFSGSGKSLYNTGSAWTGGTNATDGTTTGSVGSGNITGLTYANQFQGTTIAARDFRLKTGNGCGPGTPDSTNVPTDLYGTTRDASTPSIGAYEFAVTVVGYPLLPGNRTFHRMQEIASM
jgi:hypothetical protein